jgi:hypothetical protein
VPPVLPVGVAKLLLLPTVCVPKSPWDEEPVVLRDDRDWAQAVWLPTTASAASAITRVDQRLIMEHLFLASIVRTSLISVFVRDLHSIDKTGPRAGYAGRRD